MAYITPLHRPSSVRHALQLSFLAPNSPDLILAKANRLEIYASSPADPSQLQLQHTKTLYGKVTLLHKLRLAKSETDHLFVGTDRYHYFTLSWDPLAKQLVTERAYTDIAERSARDSQTGDRVHIDPSARFLTLECYEGVVNVLPIAHAGKGKRKAADNEIGELGTPIPVRIPELFVKSSCFLHKRSAGGRGAPAGGGGGGGGGNPELAFLWEDTNQSRLRLKIREVEYTPSLRPAEEPGTAELEKGREVQGEIELGASHLIPLPAPMYGFLILGETRISYVEEWNYEVKATQALQEATVWITWCAIDEQRYALADDYGRLYLLFLQQNSESGEYVGHRLDLLGITSRASTLVYLDAGRVFVGSHQGDSQIIQILERGLEVLQTFPNLAPVLDFTVMDMGNRSAEAPVNEFSSGQARIVTGSGAFKDGSLRSVRSGVGLEDLGSIGAMGAPVSGVWGLRSPAGGEGVDTLVVGFVASTRIFHFSADGQVEEIGEFGGFELGEGTLYAATLPDGRVVQVTSSKVLVSSSSLISRDGASVWQPDNVGGASITAISAHSTLLLLSLGGATLLLLDLSSTTDKGPTVLARRDFEPQEQVSCILLSASLPQGTCLAGFWQESKIALLSSTTLKTLATEIVAEDGITLQAEIDTQAIPRSLQIARLLAEQLPTLFVGLADGNVVTYSLASTAPTASQTPQTSPFTNRKSIILGTQQANFTLLPRITSDGLENIFATSEHPSLIYGSEGRIVYSAITAENAVAICGFDSEAYPGAIAIATAEGEVKLALVDEERTTHVQTLGVGETVRRIAYSSSLRVFGLGTIKRTLSAGEEVIESSFKIVDEVAFQELATLPLEADELVECVIRCPLADGFGGEVERFVVGTALLDDVENASVRGRILVLEVTQGREIKVVTEVGLRGACRCLSFLRTAEGEGRVVAALVKTVVIYALRYQTPSSAPFLEKKAAYRTATAPIDIAITDQTIAVTDLMKSLSLISYTPSPPGTGALDTLKEISRHFETCWGTAVACVGENTYLQSDAEGNLVVLQHEKEGFSEEIRRRLRVVSEMQLGEMVNRIRPITVQASASAAVIPRAFLATVEGGVYLFGLIAPGKQDLLIRLQTALAEIIRAPGDVPFANFRGFRSEVREAGDEGPSRFVDGELVERFLDLNEGMQETLAEALPGGVGAEEVRGIVEGLRRMR